MRRGLLLLTLEGSTGEPATFTTTADIQKLVIRIHYSGFEILTQQVMRDKYCNRSPFTNKTQQSATGSVGPIKQQHEYRR